jgi:hypothetical protein
MRIFLVPFAAAAIFAMANYGASAMSLEQAEGLKAGDVTVMSWHQNHDLALKGGGAPLR